MELQTDTVKQQTIQDMIDLVMDLQALTDGTPQDGPAEELVALQHLSSAYDGYQCWRNRQRCGALRKGVKLLPRAYATVKGLLALLDGPQGQLAKNQDDNLPALGCQNAEALSNLLCNIYARIAHVSFCMVRDAQGYDQAMSVPLLQQEN